MSRSRRGIIPEKDWENHKGRIEKLFLVERKILLGHDGVIEIMTREHGFYASKSQYETRLKKWGFRKYGTKEQWTLICHALDARRLQGKDSHVFFRGESIPEEKIERERKRYMISSNAGGRLTPIMDALSDCVRITTPPLETTLSIRASRNSSLAPQSVLESIPTTTRIEPRDGESCTNVSQPLMDPSGDTTSLLGEQHSDVSCHSNPGNQTTQVFSHVDQAISLGGFVPEFQTRDYGFPIIEVGSSDLQWSGWPLPQASLLAQTPSIPIFNLMPEVPAMEGIRPIASGSCGGRWNSDTAAVSILIYLEKNVRQISNEILRSAPIPTVPEHLQFYALLPPRVSSLLASRPSDVKSIYLAIHALCNDMVALERLSDPRTSLDHLVVGFVRYCNRLDRDALSRTLDSLPTIQSEAFQRGLFKAALEVGAQRVIEVTLERGVDPNTESTSIGALLYTPLQRCWFNGYTDITQLLITQGADPNRSMAGDQFWNSLFVAYFASLNPRPQMNWYENLLLHLKAGMKLSENMLFIHSMSKYGDRRLFPMLIDTMTDYDSSNFDICGRLFPQFIGHTDHDIASQVVEIILRKIGNPGPQQLEQLHTVLYEALYQNHTECCWRLLNSGIEPTVLCLTLAIRAVNIPLVSHFLNFGLSLLGSGSGVPRSNQRGNYTKYIDAFPIAEAIRTNCAELTDMVVPKVVNHLRENSAATCESIIAACEVGNEAVLAIILREWEDLATVTTTFPTKPVDEAFTAAIRNGHLDLIPRLLHAGIAPGSSALCAAVSAHDDSLARHFLEEAAPIIGTCKALHSAIKWGHLDLIRELVLAGFSTRTLVHSSDTADGRVQRSFFICTLSMAILSGHDAVFELLLKTGYPLAESSGANSYFTDEACHSSERVVGDISGLLTPLAAAVKVKNWPVMRTLLNLGVNPCDNVAILQATLLRDKNLTKFILDATSSWHSTYKANFGEEALLEALYFNDIELLDMLLSHTGSSQELTIGQRTIPFLDAITEHDVRFMRTFIKNGIDVNGRAHSSPDIPEHPFPVFVLATPLLLAIGTRNIEKVELLVQAGARINAPAKYRIKRTPLQAAVESGALDIIEYLLDKGADVNEEPAMREGFTALQLAAAQGFIGIAALLIERGANVNAPAARLFGRTAFEAAAEKGRIDMLMFFADQTNLDIVSDGGSQHRRAVKFAKHNGHTTTVELVERMYQEACIKAGTSLMARLDDGSGLQNWMGNEGEGGMF